MLLFLAMLLCIETRNAPAARYGLRRLAMEHDERDAIRLVQCLVSASDPQGRYWLRNLLGERPEAGRWAEN